MSKLLNYYEKGFNTIYECISAYLRVLRGGHVQMQIAVTDMTIPDTS